MARAILLTTMLAATTACRPGSDATPTATPTPPAGAQKIADPSFTALPGAKAYFGELKGSAYQIEIPDAWNGRLVLLLHGFEVGPKRAASSPPNRAALIGIGTAWAASSYSTAGFLPGVAADDTAALWDEFASRFGRPKTSYVIGASLGGAAAALSAERYPDRYSGAIGMCASAGWTPQIRYWSDYLAAAAFAAGMRNGEAINASVVRDRLLLALSDPAKWSQFEAIIIGLSGGQERLRHEGLLTANDANWLTIEALLDAQLLSNRGMTYTLTDGAGVSSAVFDAGVPRFGSEAAPSFAIGNDLTGAIKIPLLTVHNTGDAIVPIGEADAIRAFVGAAAADERLVQQRVESARHCDFTDTQWQGALDAMIAWAERGNKPTDIGSPAGAAAP